MTKIIIYTTEAYPKCKKLKTFLTVHSVYYTVADMSTPEALTELRFNGVFTITAPVLQIDDKFMTHQEIFTNDEVNPEILKAI